MGVSRPQKAAYEVSTRWVSVFCIASFFLGGVAINRFWVIPDLVKRDDEDSFKNSHQSEVLRPTVDCEKNASHEDKAVAGDIRSQVSQIHDIIMTLDKTFSPLEMQLPAARAAKGDTEEGYPVITKSGTENLKARQKVFFVRGIITAFSSRKRRDSIRETWMPKGDGLQKLEKGKEITMWLVIGHRGVMYHEPEYWKFGEEGNKYFRHATGKCTHTPKIWLPILRNILHRYASVRCLPRF